MAEEQKVVPEKPQKEFITLYEALEILGVTRKTMYNLMQEDESFPKPFSLAITDSPREQQNYRFDREELIKWVKARRVK